MAKRHGGKKWFIALGQRHKDKGQHLFFNDLPEWAMVAIMKVYRSPNRIKNLDYVLNNPYSRRERRFSYGHYYGRDRTFDQLIKGSVL